ncbi:MAG: UDP-galactopyranose mutase [Firmicutes bacterium]|nr:UDP-galactopyranose mutase [Bacillota bacterium]
MKYDYLIVGAGLFGAVFAHEAHKAGRSVLVVEKNRAVGGNIYTQEVNGIHVHKYCTHIFHTDDREIWKFVNQFAEFNRYNNAPVANFYGDMYSLPFNMYTFNKVWGVVTPEQAEERLARQIEQAGITEPQNLKEKAISMVGTDIYNRLVKGYTQKKWGSPCEDLPPSLISGFPVRMSYDNSYYSMSYQGIPLGGYTKMVENMLEGVEVRLGVDYLENKEELDKLALKTIYTGPLDAYFGYRLGRLGYRTVWMDTKLLDKRNYQGNAIVNCTDSETPWTRVIEHKYFDRSSIIDLDKTVVSREYFGDINDPAHVPAGDPELSSEAQPAYPMYDEANRKLAEEYRKLAAAEPDVIFGGRLGDYQYYDMDQVIKLALEASHRIIYRFL